MEIAIVGTVVALAAAFAGLRAYRSLRGLGGRGAGKGAPAVGHLCACSSCPVASSTNHCNKEIAS